MTEIDWIVYGLEVVMKQGINRPLTKPNLKAIIRAIEMLRQYQDDLRTMGWTEKNWKEEKDAGLHQPNN